MLTYQHYINGQFIDPKAGVWFDTENPYTGEVWAKIPRGDADDVDRAVPRLQQHIAAMCADTSIKIVNGDHQLWVWLLPAA